MQVLPGSIPAGSLPGFFPDTGIPAVGSPGAHTGAIADIPKQTAT